MRTWEPAVKAVSVASWLPAGLKQLVSGLRALLRRCVAAVRRLRRRSARRRWLRKNVRYFSALYGIELDKLSQQDVAFVRRIDTYWQTHFGRAVHPLWHLACAKVSGKQDVRFVPGVEWRNEILPFLNNLDMRAAYGDKNLKDLLVTNVCTPKTMVRKIHGEYYNGDFEPISRRSAEQALLSSPAELIIKPSLADNGTGIACLSISGNTIWADDREYTFAQIDKMYGENYLVQERIAQHSVLAEPHPDSVNTLRLITLRWNGEIRHLCTMARFGCDGRPNDNVSTGGVFCGVDADGVLDAEVLDPSGSGHTAHPTTGHSFLQRIVLPNFDQVRSLAIDLHRRLHYFNIVSWDMAIGADSQPIFLEVNVRGAVTVYQFAAKRPLFGDLTEEVLQAVRRARG